MKFLPARRARALLGAVLAAASVAVVAPATALPAVATTGRVGFIGCSNTSNAIEGYHTVSSEETFWDWMDYGGGSVDFWADPGSTYWDKFDSALAAHPGTEAIWWELCTHKNEGSNATVDAIVALIRQRLPNVAIYASPLDDTPTCARGDAVTSQGYVDYLVGKGSVLAGPVMTPLNSSQTDDGCHGNAAGKQVWGQDLAVFFDGATFPPGGGGGGGGTGTFADVPTTHTFYTDIEWLAAEGITKGCNPPDNTLFCPDDDVTRGQMAAFLDRALPLAPTTKDWFSDDDGSTFEAEINRLAAAGITKGCNPPADTAFCPGDPVTRGEMAAFLVRALGLGPASKDWFTDDDGSTFEDDINRLAAAGITKGCNPPDNTLFCPDDPVTRAEMAAFLHRGLG